MTDSSMKNFGNQMISAFFLKCPIVSGLGPNLRNSPILAANRIFYDFAVLRNIWSFNGVFLDFKKYEKCKFF